MSERMRNSLSGDPLLLKLTLLIRGVRVAGGEEDGEVELRLPDGSQVGVCVERESPYLLEPGEPDRLLLPDGEMEVRVVRPHPVLEGQTLAGRTVSQIATIRSGHLVLSPLGQSRNPFDRGVCQVCLAEFDLDGGSVEEIVSTAVSVFRRADVRGIHIKADFASGDDSTMLSLRPYVRAIKKNLPTLLSGELFAPKDAHLVDMSYAIGMDSVAYNLEIYSPDIARRLCPSRASAVDRERQIRALERAVRVFPSGAVISRLIVGLEPFECTLEGVRFLSEVGVVPALRIPPLSKSLEVESVLELIERCGEIVAGRGLSLRWTRNLVYEESCVDWRRFGLRGRHSRSRSRMAVGLLRLRRLLRVREIADSYEVSGL